MSGDEPVTVIRDGGLRAAGLQRDGVVVYDWGFERGGQAYVQRSFVLLDEEFQLNQPVLFPAEQQGWWYCDLVRVRDEGGLVRIDDLWVDVIVGPPDQPYRLLDLDEYADAVAAGRLTADEAVRGLKMVQRFLDRHLNRRHDVTPTWPDFPPSEVEALLHMELPREWSLLG